MLEDILQDDPRYTALFDMGHETTQRGQELVDDPYPLFAELRERGPVLRGSVAELVGDKHADEHFKKRFSVARDHYSVFSFDTVSQALLNNEVYSSASYDEQPFLKAMGRSILNMTGIEHQRLRRTVMPPLSLRRTEAWWKPAWIERIVDILVSDFEFAGKADLNMQLCAKVPMHTITRAMGFESIDAIDFRYHVTMLLHMGITEQERAVSSDKVVQILLDAVADRRGTPRDDLLTMLVEARVTDDGLERPLTDDELLNFVRLLMIAAGGTTHRQMGIALSALLSDPDQLDAVRRDRSLISNAIEESVRWNCTDPLFFRLTTRPSMLEGIKIPAGVYLNICLGAANRDPARWSDPDRFDISRKVIRHAGFGGGPHTCIGRFVAVAEITAALNALLDRFPNLRLDPAAEPPRIVGGLEARGISNLHVRFD